MVKLVHEVWQGENQVAMFLRDSPKRHLMIPPQGKLLHTFEAESVFEAFRIYYQLMDWGAWKPPENMDDVVYTGDEVKP